MGTGTDDARAGQEGAGVRPGDSPCAPLAPRAQRAPRVIRCAFCAWERPAFNRHGRSLYQWLVEHARKEHPERHDAIEGQFADRLDTEGA